MIGLDFDNQPLGRAIEIRAARVIALAVEPTMQTMAAFIVVDPIRGFRHLANARPDETVLAQHVCAAGTQN
ncbi:hypothetical protein D3C72_2146780 [compost metagenome]